MDTNPWNKYTTLNLCCPKSIHSRVVQAHSCNPYYYLTYVLCFSNTDAVLEVIVHVAHVRLPLTESVHHLLSSLDSHASNTQSKSITRDWKGENLQYMCTCRYMQHIYMKPQQVYLLLPINVTNLYMYLAYKTWFIIKISVHTLYVYAYLYAASIIGYLVNRLLIILLILC